MTPLPEGSWKKCHTRGTLPAWSLPRAVGLRPEGGSRQAGARGRGIFDQEPEGRGGILTLLTGRTAFCRSGNFEARESLGVQLSRKKFAAHVILIGLKFKMPWVALCTAWSFPGKSSLPM